MAAKVRVVVSASTPWPQQQLSPPAVPHPQEPGARRVGSLADLRALFPAATAQTPSLVVCLFGGNLDHHAHVAEVHVSPLASINMFIIAYMPQHPYVRLIITIISISNSLIIFARWARSQMKYSTTVVGR